jgi:hypothetical protein
MRERARFALRLTLATFDREADYCVMFGALSGNSRFASDRGSSPKGSAKWRISTEKAEVVSRGRFRAQRWP